MSLFTINEVTLVGGNLTRDIEIKFLPNGTAQGKFDIAMNRSYPDGQGGYKEETSYFRVILWGKPAEKLAPQLRKGQKVAVQGRLSQRRWETDGKTNSIVEVVADTVIPYTIPKRDDIGEYTRQDAAPDFASDIQPQDILF